MAVFRIGLCLACGTVYLDPVPALVQRICNLDTPPINKVKSLNSLPFFQVGARAKIHVVPWYYLALTQTTAAKSDVCYNRTGSCMLSVLSRSRCQHYHIRGFEFTRLAVSETVTLVEVVSNYWVVSSPSKGYKNNKRERMKSSA